MFAFEVSLNGKKICTAAQQDFGTLHAEIMRMKMMAPRDPKGDPADQVIKESTRLSLRGVRGGDMRTGAYAEWLAQNLKMGDEILIRIVETNDGDEPGVLKPVSEVSRRFR